jgi:transcriptional regulator with XRE-family HTH domain
MVLIYSFCCLITVTMKQIKDSILLLQIASRIKELRTAKGITQEVFYNDTNIHIARIERGNLNISVSTLNAICIYLGTNLSDFFKSI